jgi:FAD/FMN-containing dehydrogenase
MTAGQWDPSGTDGPDRPGGPDRGHAPGQPPWQSSRSGRDPRQPPGRGGPDRRKFLLVGGLTVVAGASVGAAVLTQGAHRGGPPVKGDAGTSPSVTHAATPVPTADHSPATLQASDWDALDRELSTRKLVRPGDPGYGTAKLLFDPKFDSISPAGIAYCAVPGDVSACLAFARKFELKVAARSGGHSYGGWSTTSGLVIDVSRMSRVKVNAAAGTAAVGAGTLLIDLYDQLAAHGLAVPGGSCPTVGVAGLALGGGVGVVGRKFGLTCDNVVGVQIVTADGVVHDTSAGSDPDLFWACRGGGGGSFGVVTSFTLRTHPVPDLVLFYLQWPWSAAASVIDAWQRWAPAAPDDLWSNLHLAAGPGITPQLSVGGTYAGSVSGAQSLLSKLYAAAGSAPPGPFVQSEGYLTTMLVEAGCSSLSVAQCHLPSQNPAGQLGRPPEYAKSDFYTKPLSAAGISTLLAQVEKMQQVNGASGASGGVAFDAFGGAINRVSPAATAFAHRDALFLAQYSTGWTPPPGHPDAGKGTAPVENQLAWLRSFHAAMRPFASGQAYQNYADPDLADWQRAYYGANYPRLQRVKAAVDPADVFRFPQSIELPA